MTAERPTRFVQLTCEMVETDPARQARTIAYSAAVNVANVVNVVRVPARGGRAECCYVRVVGQAEPHRALHSYRQLQEWFTAAGATFIPQRAPSGWWALQHVHELGAEPELGCEAAREVGSSRPPRRSK